MFNLKLRVSAFIWDQFKSILLRYREDMTRNVEAKKHKISDFGSSWPYFVPYFKNFNSTFKPYLGLFGPFLEFKWKVYEPRFDWYPNQVNWIKQSVKKWLLTSSTMNARLYGDRHQLPKTWTLLFIQWDIFQNIQWITIITWIIELFDL